MNRPGEQRQPTGDAAGIGSLRNVHPGQRAFVIGNGPSLTVADLEMLRNEITFASNKIYLAFGDTSWRPTYYTVCDHLVAHHNAEMISMPHGTALFPSTLREFGCSFENGFWYEERFENKFVSQLSESDIAEARLFFSHDACQGIHGGYTVIYHQLQLAYHMGITQVYLIGIDFSFSVPTTTASDNRFQSQVYSRPIVCQGEVNHFHKDYRKPGETWSVPRLDLQQRAFLTALAEFEENGGALINVSRKTALRGVPRATLEAALNRNENELAHVGAQQRRPKPSGISNLNKGGRHDSTATCLNTHK